MTERTKFVLEWQRRLEDGHGRVDIAELCRVFGVSRQTGYVWIRRFREASHDVRAMEDRSRRPRTSPTAVPREVEDLVVDLRKHRPKWGPRKLRAWLIDRYPGRQFPSASSVATILKRNGLATARRRRRRPHVPRLGVPLGAASAPNEIWCIDFKGHFRTLDREWCYPLTIVDAFCRFCIRCESVIEPSYYWAERVLDSAFREFGLPAAIRSDNGAPFAANGPFGLSRLAVWLLRLGIRLERITPGRPQENGRLERFHRTLHEATASPPAAHRRAQQRAFDHFRREYNEERPHEALGMKPPAAFYVPSSRRYPCRLVDVQPGPWAHRLVVDEHGTIRWGRRRIFVSHALVGQMLGATPDAGSRWILHFGGIEIGSFDGTNIRPELRASPRSRRAHYLEVSGMSLD